MSAELKRKGGLDEPVLGCRWIRQVELIHCGLQRLEAIESSDSGSLLPPVLTPLKLHLINRNLLFVFFSLSLPLISYKTGHPQLSNPLERLGDRPLPRNTDRTFAVLNHKRSLQILLYPVLKLRHLDHWGKEDPTARQSRFDRHKFAGETSSSGPFNGREAILWMQQPERVV
ncbi:hypothetical protein SNK03_011093 [Fusarium graminearum]|uniref:Chromosome 3, complete genome n=1 Tax=Gibberella zeae (strain ATCC MYA-4620 / CBS 123657 / FGSC 9075 / NRRL 31084 / PH-1) TaxID=229533 RepID=I1S772_GIBZE|nr:hypothetical protein FGSG_12695 [Fusarium graminearum PH-1]ESU11087.1 hypothetical protein FGSG_12695 [Fusarium graminearum PH-1]EYB22173.1 hypothetical protein FG05_12695 [Fusarium graminearum]CEF87689.1 unnamed protein product [Fusarium graminearum]CZS83731.1 unnamed protein product [Fusarium graminearum]|eukprot:XP_011323663.1 hypothetical protein FGSG_12695 [Fusarium graminearum PH-1]